MAHTWKMLAEQFEAGVRTDLDKFHYPAGSMRACRDFVPRLEGAPLRCRQVWGNYAVSDTGYVHELTHAPFAAPELVEVQDDLTLRTIPDSTGTRSASKGSLDSLPAGRPVLYKGKVVVPTAGTAGHRLVTWDGTTFALIAAGTAVGQAPPARHLAPYKARLLAAGTAANPNRLFISENSAAPSFDSVNNIIDLAGGDVLGLAALRSGAFAFHADSVTRIRGTTPGALGDIELDNNFWPVGIAANAAHATCFWKDNLIWFSEQGVYMTDGASFVNLTEQGGIRNTWTYNLSSYVVGAGVYQDYLVVTVIDPASPTAEIAAWFCYLPTRSWFNLGNMPFRVFAATTKGAQALFGGRADVIREAGVSTMFTSGNNGLTDGNGVGLAAGLGLNFQHDGPGSMALGNVWVGYALRSANATLSVSYSREAQDTGYDGLATAGALPATDTDVGVLTKQRYGRKPIYIGGDAPGVNVNLAMTNTALDCELYSVELEYERLQRYR